MKTILVPTDFSNVSTNALELATELAYKIHAKIVLLHAVHETHDAITINGETYSHGPGPGSKARYTGVIGEKMYELGKFIHKVQVKSCIGFGGVKDVILDAIDKHEADLVVMGSKGASGVKELLVGSNAELVIRYAKCPVVTVKEPTELASIESILLATDMSLESEGALKRVVELQKMLELKLILLNVRNNLSPKTKTVTEKAMKLYAESYKLENYEVKCVMAEFIEDGILEAAEKLNAGFIAMGTHGNKGFEHLVKGSHAENVANHTHKPLISYQYENFPEFLR